MSCVESGVLWCADKVNTPGRQRWIEKEWNSKVVTRHGPRIRMEVIVDKGHKVKIAQDIREIV